MKIGKSYKKSIESRLPNARIDDALDSYLHPHFLYFAGHADIRDEILKLLQKSSVNVSLKDFAQSAALSLASKMQESKTRTKTRKAFR